MPTCPKCGAICPEGDRFCEFDGASLRPREKGAAVPNAQLPPSAPCPNCGSDRGKEDGYCVECGRRIDRDSTLGLDPTLTPLAPIEVGQEWGGRKVIEVFADDDGIVENGPRFLHVRIGDPQRLTIEANALKAARATSSVLPDVVDRGQRDDGHGYLVLEFPEAVLPFDRDQNLDNDLALSLAAQILALCHAVDRASYTWSPSPQDWVMFGASLGLSCLRNAIAQTDNITMNAKTILESFVRRLAPDSMLGCDTRLVRLFLPYFEADTSIEAQLNELAEVRHALATAPKESTSNIGESIDPGLARNHQQDAIATAVGTRLGEPYCLLVVCDGVSSSTLSGPASRLAADTARASIEKFLSIEPETSKVSDGITRAIRAAHKATCEQWPSEPEDNEPGSTIVCALIFAGRAYVGWLGDSRAYCVTNDQLVPLTRDHSWVNEALDRGDIKSATEVRGALAHTITRCIGPLEESADVTPDLREFDLPNRGAIILCSDGLWNEAVDNTIASIARNAMASHGASVVARRLLNFALFRGGHDNISVAVHTFART